MLNKYVTERLVLEPLVPEDAAFIFELVNTAGWIQFIGDRNIHGLDDASAYIRKIMSNPSILYLVVRLADQQVPVGIVSFIKRDYLAHHDIGFAFLDRYKGAGYAFEAASVVLKDVLQDHDHVLATTIKDNHRSIQLLEKLGFSFHKEIMHDKDALFVFRIAAEK